jgi:hypothetical protein
MTPLAPSRANIPLLRLIVDIEQLDGFRYILYL